MFIDRSAGAPLTGHGWRRSRLGSVSPATLVPLTLCALLVMPVMVTGQKGAVGLLPESREGAKLLLNDGQLTMTPAQATQKDEILKGILQDALTQQREQLAGITHPVITRNQYITQFPEVDSKGKADFKMQIIFDPCQGEDVDCCDGIYAEPEYKEVVADNSEVPRRGDGTVMPAAASRLADSEVVYDQSCDIDDEDNVFRHIDEPTDFSFVEENDLPFEADESKAPPKVGSDGSFCVGLNAAVRPFSQVPRCWDRNTTIDSTQPCTGKGGTAHHCVIVGYSSNAYVPECGGQYRTDGFCGTYLEVHPVGRDNETVLSEVHVAGGLHTGFRVAALPLTYLKDPWRIICRGDYEIWWVQRTRYNRVVEFVKRFRIIEPECEFDQLTSKSFMFAWLEEAIGTQERLEYERELIRIQESLRFDYRNVDLGLDDERRRRITEHTIIDEPNNAINATDVTYERNDVVKDAVEASRSTRPSMGRRRMAQQA